MRIEEYWYMAGQVANEHGIDLWLIIGKTRRREVVRARWALWLRMRALGLSTVKIGNLANRDHSTIIHALQTMTGNRRI